jgi:hypothetical protein
MIEINKNDVIRFTEVTPNNYWTIKTEFLNGSSGYAYRSRNDNCIGHVDKDWLLWMIDSGKAEIVKK